MGYKFQELQVYKISLEYLDQIYALAKKLPETEKFNLRTQIQRAATSVVLNIAEGSTGQRDPEQGRFLGLASRSFLETVACFDIMIRRKYFQENELRVVKDLGNQLFMKLQAFKKAIRT
ncbi:MAG: four helix bundle protein [Deltaproteobacteria bacterium]|nr:four helix bundle protein [Deltaproteobacteria bacterium]